MRVSGIGATKRANATKADFSLILQEKLPRATLFGLITRNDVENLIKSNFSDEGKSKLLRLARGRLRDEGFVIKAEDKVFPRENVLISDKSLADSAEALIGLFLSRSRRLLF